MIRNNPRTTLFVVLWAVAMIRVQDIARTESQHEKANIARVCMSQNDLRANIIAYLAVDLKVSGADLVTAQDRFAPIACPERNP